MSDKKNEKRAMSLQVTEGLTVTVLPDPNHEFLMPTRQVSTGYGVTVDTINRHKIDHSDELIEGKHFLGTMRITHSGSPGSSIGTLWTKRGIVRLGFFIKSERARMFRDWAEDLVISQAGSSHKTSPGPSLLRRGNSTARENLKDFRELADLVESAAMLCGSRVKLAARLGISAANFTHLVKHPWWLSENMLKAIETGCRNIIAGNNVIDTEAIEALMMVENKDSRIVLFNKMRKGGLL